MRESRLGFNSQELSQDSDCDCTSFVLCLFSDHMHVTKSEWRVTVFSSIGFGAIVDSQLQISF